MQMGMQGGMQDGSMQPLLNDAGVNISFVAGTIKDGDEPIRMQRMLFRITRGKALTHFSEPFVQDKQQKVVYMVVFQDGQMIRDRVTKICDSFMGSRFEIPGLGDQLFQELGQVRTQIMDDRELLKETKRQVQEYLRSINGNCDETTVPSQLEVFHNHVVKEKAIYTIINQLQKREANYIGFLWAPVALEDLIRPKLQEFQTVEFQSWRGDPSKPHDIMPPTFFKTNDWIAPLQLITNTYGVPSYQEANPATFAIVTFPFLFAVMFGDYGHGSLLLFLGLCMVFGYDHLKDTAAKDALFIRYLFMMMGFFSCYNGLLYNEWFAIPYPWFQSCYETNPLPGPEIGYVFPYVDFPGTNQTPTEYGTECVYPFGMDPTWFLSANDILVAQDSMKMKISVIIAVIHMTMGICTKGLNMIYFNNKLAFWTEVVTGVIILNGLFGWMDVLIVIKWFYKMNPYSTN